MSKEGILKEIRPEKEPGADHRCLKDMGRTLQFIWHDLELLKGSGQKSDMV